MPYGPGQLKTRYDGLAVFFIRDSSERFSIDSAEVLFCRVVVAKDWCLDRGKGTPLQVFLVGSFSPEKKIAKQNG
jgi:hypothetical protein